MGAYNVYLKNGDRVTQGTLSLFLEENKPLVYYVFEKWFGGNKREKEDLVQVGWIGLWRAVERYDERTNFGTFATTCIRNEMLVYMIKQNKYKPEYSNTEVASEIGLEQGEDIEKQLDIKMALEKVNCPATKKMLYGQRVVEIAEEREVTTNMIYKQIKKERKKLLAEMGEKSI